MADKIERKIANTLMAPISMPKDPAYKAIARRLGLDSPEGRTAFISQFKSSYPSLITDRTEELYPMVEQEMISRLPQNG